jgi:hypothetical protein
MRRTYRTLIFVIPGGFAIALSGTVANVGAQAALRAPVQAAPVHATAATARAKAVPAVEYSCSGNINTPFRQCYLQTQKPLYGGTGHAPLFAPNGSLHALLPLNDKVLVTCYYFGNPPSPYIGDGIEDHVTWENTIGNFTGHIPDAYIDEGNADPYNYPFDLDEC